MTYRLTISTLALLATVTACSLAPDFNRPVVNDSTAFKEAPTLGELTADEAGTWKVAQPSAELPRGEWWRVFGDERLNALVEEAVANNDEVKVYAARVKQARASAKVARSYLFPTIDNTSGFTRRQPNAVGRGLAPGTALGIENDYSTSFGLTYELDVLGRVRGSWLASRLDAKAAAAQYQSVKLALQADVAELYFSLRAADRDIDILERGIGLRSRNARILEQKSEAGDITALDVSSSVVDLENTRNALHDAEFRRAQLEHALAVALGRVPADFSFDKVSIVTKIPVVPAGLPSSLLERRPDVTAAQKALEASNERIGLARAAFFPTLLLTGSGGFQSDVLGQLFQWSSRSWAFGPLLTIPIFGGGRAVANLDRSKAQYEEAVHIYRGQVLEAFRDVEDALSRLRALSKQAASQYRAEHAAKQAARIATLRYEEGDIGYLESITARREALETERLGVELKRARLSATVQLIRALGGSWDAPPAIDVTPVNLKQK
ncbi:MAG TPA: efflux transporter outer membrane subunit [Patescibacteria group bacterium]|nr:efflux transporter outer membrane subunit [Patescibacteria group bacterium]